VWQALRASLRSARLRWVRTLGMQSSERRCDPRRFDVRSRKISPPFDPSRPDDQNFVAVVCGRSRGEDRDARLRAPVLTDKPVQGSQKSSRWPAIDPTVISTKIRLSIRHPTRLTDRKNVLVRAFADLPRRFDPKTWNGSGAPSSKAGNRRGSPTTSADGNRWRCTKHGPEFWQRVYDRSGGLVGLRTHGILTRPRADVALTLRVRCVKEPRSNSTSESSNYAKTHTGVVRESYAVA